MDAEPREPGPETRPEPAGPDGVRRALDRVVQWVHDELRWILGEVRTMTRDVKGLVADVKSLFTSLNSRVTLLEDRVATLEDRDLPDDPPAPARACRRRRTPPGRPGRSCWGRSPGH